MSLFLVQLRGSQHPAQRLLVLLIVAESLGAELGLCRKLCTWEYVEMAEMHQERLSVR